jgi:hypothetical protein
MMPVAATSNGLSGSLRSSGSCCSCCCCCGCSCGGGCCPSSLTPSCPPGSGLLVVRLSMILAALALAAAAVVVLVAAPGYQTLYQSLFAFARALTVFSITRGLELSHFSQACFSATIEASFFFSWSMSCCAMSNWCFFMRR